MDAPLDFPVDLLVAEGGTISKRGDRFAISLKLAPFYYPYDSPSEYKEKEDEPKSILYTGEDVDATLIINELPLGLQEFTDLSYREFRFPPNPELGYVESSIFIWESYNPIDVLRICFGSLQGQSIEATFLLRFVFSFEGLCKDVEKEMTTTLTISASVLP